MQGDAPRPRSPRAQPRKALPVPASVPRRAAARRVASLSAGHSGRSPPPGRSARCHQRDRHRTQGQPEALRAVHALAQHQRRQQHRERRVQRRPRPRHGQVAAPAGHHEQPGRQRPEQPADDAQRPPRSRQPRLPQAPPPTTIDAAGDRLVERQRQQPGVLGDPGQRDEQGRRSRARPAPRRRTPAEPVGYRRPPARARRTRSPGTPPRSRSTRRRPAARRSATPTTTGHDRRADAGDRRHHAHPPRGEPAVEERGAEPVAQPGQQRPGQVRARRARRRPRARPPASPATAGQRGERDRPRR